MGIPDWSADAPVRRMHLLERARARARILLVFYALAFGILAGAHLDSVLPPSREMVIQQDRLQGARRALAGMQRGWPPLLGSYRGHPYAVGISDDPGYYVYVPYLARLTHQTDPRVVLRWSYIVLFSLLIASLPISFLALTGSWAAAVLAPIVVFFQFGFLDNTDIYWINGWVVLFLLPIVLATYRFRWTWRSVAVLTAVTVVASWATSIRLHSGLPIVLAAAAVGVIRQPGRPAKAGVVVLLAAAYLSVYPMAFNPIFAARDRAAAAHGLAGPPGSGASLSAIYPHTHVTWHNIYIGLGYLPNRYGISWSDSVARKAAERYDPGVRYVSKRYDRDLRHLVFQILRKDPGFVWRNIETKTRFEVAHAFHEFAWTVLLLPAIFGLGRTRRRELLLYLGLTVPALVLTLLPPVLTIPAPFYSIGFYTTAGFVWLLAATWFAGVTGPELAGRTFAHLRAAPAGAIPPVRDFLTRRNGIVLGLTVAAAITVAYRPALREASLRLRGPAGTPSELTATRNVRGRTLATWTFGVSLPKGWFVFAGVGVTHHADSVAVTTTDGRFQYQLQGPTRRLGPGHYSVTVSGVVTTGGLDVGILDSTKDTWIAQHGYSEGQHFGGHLMVTSFILRRTTTVRVVFSNWLAADGISKWTLRSARLLATAPGR